MLPFIQPRATKWRKTELASLSGHRAEKDTNITHTIVHINPLAHSYPAIIATYYTLLVERSVTQKGWGQAWEFLL